MFEAIFIGFDPDGDFLAAKVCGDGGEIRLPVLAHELALYFGSQLNRDVTLAQRRDPALASKFSCGCPLRTELSAEQVEATLLRQENRWWSLKLQSLGSKEHFLRYAGRYARRPPIASVV